MAEAQDAQLRNRRKTDQEEEVRGVRIRVLNIFIVILTCVFAILFFITAHSVSEAYSDFEDASASYVEYETAASDFKEASNYLTAQVRSYVVTHRQSYIQRFVDEIASDRREVAVETMRGHLDNDESTAYLEKALKYSDQLMQRELYAMMLVADGVGHDLSQYSDLFGDIQLSAKDRALSNDEKIERGTSLVFDNAYQVYIDRISDSVALCKESLTEEIAEARDNGAAAMKALLFRQQLIVAGLLLSILFLIVAFSMLALRPLRVYIEHIRKNDQLPMVGAYELRFMAQAYNVLHEENLRTHDQLLRRAERDHLTDLYNRSVFEKSIDMHQCDPVALLLIDADYFKNINDTLGHDAGDAMLKKLAGLLMSSFRITDYPCRIGGDEFAVIMAEVTPDLSPVIVSKIQKVRAGMADEGDGLPAMTISVGIAFSDGSLDSDELYKNADRALYKVKEAGRDGYGFYDGD